MSNLLLLFVSLSFGQEVITPDTCVRLVIENDPSVAMQYTELSRAEWMLKGEKHRYSPNFGLEGSFLDSNSPNAFGGDLFVGENRTLAGSASLVQPLPWGMNIDLSYGLQRGQTSTLLAPTIPPIETGPLLTSNTRLAISQNLWSNGWLSTGLGAIRQAKHGVEIADLSARSAASRSARDALIAYWELVFASQFEAVQLQSLDTARLEMTENQARVETGSLSSSALLAFETRLNALEEELVQATIAKEGRHLDLQRRLALDSDFDVYIEFPDDPTILGEEFVNEIVDTSLEVLLEIENVRLAKTQVKTAGDGTEPQLAIQGYVQFSGLHDEPSGSRIEPNEAISAYVGLTGNLDVDRTRHVSELKRAKLAVLSSEQRLDATKRALRMEIEQSIHDARGAKRRLELATRTVNVAQTQLDMERERLKVGSAIALEVRQAEDDLRAAESRKLRARADLAIGHVKFQHWEDKLLKGYMVTATP